MEIKIRFNTNYPEKSDKKWRLLILGMEKLVDEIKIECPSFTSTDEVEVDGKKVTKYHISVVASQVTYETKDEKIKAVIK